MVRVREIVFSLFVWSFIAMGCSDKFALLEIGSPAKRRTEMQMKFCDVHPVGLVSPQEIFDKACSPDIFFKEYVLSTQGGEMAEAWLRNFLSEAEVEGRISQELLDKMLADVCVNPDVSPSLIEQLLSYGADPCVGFNPPIICIFKQLSSRNSDPGSVGLKLYAMLEFMCKDFCVRQYSRESFADAAKRLTERITNRLDYKNDLRDKFGEFGKKQSDEACALHCHVWGKICLLLGARRLRSSDDELSSPSRRERTAFDVFSARCVDACIARGMPL